MTVILKMSMKIWLINLNDSNVDHKYTYLLGLYHAILFLTYKNINKYASKLMN